MKFTSIALVLLLATPGCFLLPSKGSVKTPENDGRSDNHAKVATEDPPEPPSTPVEPSLTEPEIAAEMAPPDGLLDLRTVVGTDRETPLPRIFDQAKKGMTRAELNEVFPGVMAHRLAFVSYTTANKGKTWYRVKGNQPHRELLDLAFEDNGGLKRISYAFDPNVHSQELWMYLLHAAKLKWGAPTSGNLDASSDHAVWDLEGVKEVRIGNMKSHKFITIDVDL